MKRPTYKELKSDSDISLLLFGVFTLFFAISVLMLNVYMMIGTMFCALVSQAEYNTAKKLLEMRALSTP